MTEQIDDLSKIEAKFRDKFYDSKTGLKLVSLNIKDISWLIDSFLLLLAEIKKKENTDQSGCPRNVLSQDSSRGEYSIETLERMKAQIKWRLSFVEEQIKKIKSESLLDAEEDSSEGC